jgi:hypothetical protein
MPIDAHDERWGVGMRTVTASLPYQCIIQTRRRREDEREFSLQEVPSEDQIIELAVKAIDAVRKQLVDIRARWQEAEGGSTAS